MRSTLDAGGAAPHAPRRIPTTAGGDSRYGAAVRRRRAPGPAADPPHHRSTVCRSVAALPASPLSAPASTGSPRHASPATMLTIRSSGSRCAWTATTTTTRLSGTTSQVSCGGAPSRPSNGTSPASAADAVSPSSASAPTLTRSAGCRPCGCRTARSPGPWTISVNKPSSRELRTSGPSVIVRPFGCSLQPPIGRVARTQEVIRSGTARCCTSLLYRPRTATAPRSGPLTCGGVGRQGLEP